jgi:hypothetical protein
MNVNNYLFRFVFLLFLGNNCLFSQTTLLTQNFGTTGTMPTGWTASGSFPPTLNNAITSSGYTGASGNYNVLYIDNGTGTNILTYNNNFSTVGYTNITVLWGGRRNTAGAPTLDFYWSTDGSTWNGPVSHSQVATDAVWALANNGTRITLPTGAEGVPNLRLRFQAVLSSSSSTISYRIDDITVQGCAVPTTAASSITFSGINCAGMTSTWTNGNGSNRIVVAKAGSAVSGTPVNSTTYTASTVFGSGSTIATGEYVIYNGSSNSIALTGLSGSTTYYFKVFEYNCSSGSENYLTASPPSNSQATSANPTNTWTGTTSTAWATTTNWSLNALPGACDNIIIPNVTNDPIVSGAISVNSITIQNGGILQANAAITINGTFTINNGGTYIHNNTTSPKTTIFNGTEGFASNSTFEIRNWPDVNTYPHNGSTTASDVTITGTYGNLTINWNLPAEWLWMGYMTSPSSMVAGTLSFTSTGATYDVNMIAEGANHYLNNLTINGGKVSFKGRDEGSVYSNSVLNLSGDFILSSGKFYIEEDGELPAVGTVIRDILLINGDLTISGGTFDFNGAQVRNNQGINEIRVVGNTYLNGGTITQTNNGASGLRYFAYFKFTGSGTQTYSENGTQVIDQHDYYIAPGSTLQLTSNMKIISSSSPSKPTFYIAGTLNAQNYQVYPSTTLTGSGVWVFDGGRLQTSNTAGFYTANSASTTLKDNLATKHTVTVDPLGVIEYNGTASQAITTGTLVNLDGTALSTARHYGILDINNTASGGSAVTMAASVTTDQLRLNQGVVSTGANNLIVLNTTAGSAGGIQNHSVTSYVNTGTSGKLRRYVTNSGYPLSYDFPMGNSNSGSYQLMNINITSGNTASYLDVNFDNPSNAAGSGLPLSESGFSFNALIKNGGNSTDATYGGVWTVTPDAGTATYSMSLYGMNYSTWGAGRHTIVKRANSAGAWALAGSYSSGSGTPSPITGTRTGFSGFSQFALARSGTPVVLPIELLEFSVTCENNNAILKWTTASEVNNDLFTVEKSEDGKNLYPIGTIKGAGNSTSLNRYSYTDHEILPGTSYYRLTQTDYDGKKENLGLLTFQCNEEQPFNFSLISNPVENDNIPISLAGASDKQVLIVMIDVYGRVIYSKQTIETTNRYTYIIRPVSTIVPGIYTIIASSDEVYVSKKVMVK